MTVNVLLCSDLDRTILPNGEAPESPEARPRLHQLAARPEVTLVYVSGRHRALLQEAIDGFGIPVPDYAVGDVGTTIHRIQGGTWSTWDAWHQEIAPDWAGRSHDDLAALLTGVPGLRVQEPEKQNVFKLSYYVDDLGARGAIVAEVERRLAAAGVQASVVWSVDDLTREGLLDVLPRNATKRHAVEFLMRELGAADTRTVFSGDSGNDLPVLTSGLQAVLVANARDDVREEALAGAQAAGRPERLYVARGGFLGMNGNYSAGVLEGLAHFVPEVEGWLS